MSLSNNDAFRALDPEIIEKRSKLRIAYLTISGMGCSNCAVRIQNALLQVQGVSEVIIDDQDGLGQVKYDPQFVSDELLVKTVSAAGNDGHHHYEAQLIKL